MTDMILRTPEQTTPEWFAIERGTDPHFLIRLNSFHTSLTHTVVKCYLATAWTAEIGADVSIVLTSHRSTPHGKKQREIALVVAHGYGKRLTTSAADSLFDQLVGAIEKSDELGKLTRWKRPDGKKLLERRMVWTHESEVGRKGIRPVVEKATREWEG